MIFRADSGEEMEYLLGADHPVVVVGRHKSCGIRTKNNTVSRRHAQVSLVDGAYQLVDRGSSNGTFFQAKRISEHWLEDGDEFQCGAFPVRFELDDEEQPILDAEPLLMADPMEEDSALYPVAEEIGDGYDDAEGIAFGESAAPFPPPAFDEMPLPALPADEDDIIEAVAVEESAELVDAEPIDAEVFLEPEFLPEIPETIKSQAPPLPPPPLDDSPFDAMPFELPPAEPAEADGPALADGGFDEFNRQLQLKDDQLADMRDRVRVAEERSCLLEAQVQALSHTVEEHAAAGVSTSEFTALSEENDGLRTSVSTLGGDLSTAQERLKSLEGQILRIQDGQPTPVELEELKAAKAERDRLWEDRETLEGQLLDLKKRLKDAAGAGDSAAAAQIEDMQEQLDEAHGEADRLSAALETAQDEAAEAKESLGESEEKAADLRDEIASLENRLDEASKGPTSSDVDDLKAKLDGLTERNDELKKKIAQLREAADDDSERITALEKERDDFHDMLSDTSETEALGSKIDSLSKQVALLEEERDELKDEAKVGATELKSHKKKLAALESEAEELKDLLAGMPDEKAVSELQRRCESAEAELASLKGEAEDLTTALEATKKDLASLEKRSSKSSERLSRALESANAERDDAQRSARALKKKVDELEEILVHAPDRTQFDSLTAEVETLTRERDKGAKKLLRESSRVEELSEKLAELEERAAKAAEDVDTLKGELRDTTRAATKAESTAKRRFEAASKKHEAALGDREARIAEFEGRVAELEGDLESERQAVESAAKATDEQRTRAESLESELAKVGAELKAARREAQKVSKLAEELEQTNEEREDLLIANKGQVKRVSSLLKQVEQLKAEVASAGDNEEAVERAQLAEQTAAQAEEANAALRRELEEATKSGERFARKVRRLERELEETAANAGDSGALEEELRGARRELETLAAQNEQLAAEVERAKSAGSAVAEQTRGAASINAVGSLVDDINDRISAFRNNCETVQFCLEDIKAGVDASDNHAAAAEMLEANGEEVDAIKKALRRFRREHLNG